MRSVLLFSSFFIAINAFCFTGNWSGIGEFETHKRSGDCREVFFSLKIKDSKLYLLEGGYNCHLLSAEYPPSVFEIEGENLLYRSKVVGKINDTQVFLAQEEFTLELTKKDDVLFTKETWEDSQSFLSVKGKLKLR